MVDKVILIKLLLALGWERVELEDFRITYLKNGFSINLDALEKEKGFMVTHPNGVVRWVSISELKSDFVVMGFVCEPKEPTTQQLNLFKNI